MPINNISNNTKELYSNLFKNYQTYNELINQIYGIGKIYPNVQQIYVRNSNITTLAEWKTWLSTHNTDVYYVLATPELIDLNTTIDVTLFEGINNISNSEDANMQIRYVKNNEL